MAGLHDYTTKEVLNKVLLDSSGDAVAAFSHTTQEALNAVLDSSNSRLNVSLTGGTISGDVTISGDLTVSGGGSYAYSEVVIGDMAISDTTTSSATKGGKLILSANDGAVMDAHHQLGMLDFAGATTAESTSGARDGTITSGARIRATTDTTWGGAEHGTNLDFFTSDGSTALASGDPMMRINALGWASIGTDNAQSKLHVVHSATANSKALLVDHNMSGTGASDGTGVNIDFDRTDPGSGTAAHNDIGIDLDVNSSSKGTSTVKGMDIDVVGAGTGTQVATGIDVDVSGGDTNISAHLAGAKGGFTTSGASLGSTASYKIDMNGSNMVTFHPGASNIFIKDNYNFWNSVGITTPTLSAYDGTGTSGARIYLQTKETTVVDNDVLGSIQWLAPAEATGGTSGDQRLPGAAIWAEAEATFSDTVNSTGLVFGTATSETAVGQERVRISSSGKVGAKVDLMCGSSDGTYTQRDTSLSIYYGSGGYAGNLNWNKNGHATQYQISGNETVWNFKSLKNDQSIKFYTTTSSTTGVRFVLDANSRISLSNNDSGSTGGMDSTTGNTIFGHLAGASIASGGHNNLLIGHKSGNALTTGVDNTAIGVNAMKVATVGVRNTAIGKNVMVNTDGTAAADGGAGGSAGTLASSDNVFIGFDSGSGVWAGSDSNENIAIGNYTMDDALDGAIGNIGIGHYSSSEITTGTYNTAVGWESLKNITAGRFNVAIGYQALLDADNNEEGNVAIGYKSSENLNYNGSGNNVSIGYHAMQGGSISAAITDNIAIGEYTLSSITTADESVAIGGWALSSLTTGTNNVAIGHKAAMELATNHHNTVVGSHAMYRSGAAVYYNTFIGSMSGSGDWSGGAYSNTAVGANTMTGVMTGAAIGNVAIGRDALNSITSGANNVGIGLTAGAALVGATENVIIGNAAMSACDTGIGNVVIGADAGNHANNDVDGAIIIGHDAGQGAMTATDDNNIYIGHKAGQAIAVGHHGQKNVLIGYQAGLLLTKGDGNTVLGHDCLVGTTKANFNTGIGYHALTGMNQSSDTDAYNTALGYAAGDGITTGINNTLLGALADTDTATTSNQTVIGSAGIFKFQSKEYTCDHASNDDQDIASSTTPIKIPANAVIKSVSAIVTQLSNLGTYILNVVYSDDSTAPNDDDGMTNGIELIGVGGSGSGLPAQTSKSGVDGNAADIDCGTSAGAVKRAYYNGFDGNGKHVGTSDRYIHLVNAGTGNGDTDPSTAAKVKVLVEYVGLD